MQRVVLAFACAVCFFLASCNSDVAMVTVFSGYAFLYAEAIAWLLARLGKPYVLALHGGDLPAFSRRHAVRVRRLLSRAGAVVCPSGYLYEALKHLRPDLKLIPNAVDLSRYEFGSRSIHEGRLVWLRAFHHIYNPMMAPAVLAKVLKTFPQARLTMVGPDKGDGSYQATRQAAADLGVLDRIRFTGPIPKDSVPQVIGEHDIFLNTTNVDNTPVSLIDTTGSRTTCPDPARCDDLGFFDVIPGGTVSFNVHFYNDFVPPAASVCPTARWQPTPPRCRSILRRRSKIRSTSP